MQGSNRQTLSGIADPVERRTAIALHAARIGVFEFEPQTARAYWDDRIRELWGVPQGEDITYDTVIAQVHQDDRDAHNAMTQDALDPKGTGHFDLEYRVLPRDGKPMRWIHAIAACYFEDGEAVRMVGTVQDVTERRLSEERSKMLLYELEHRVKNTLATAISVVKLSRRGQEDTQAYAKAIESRLISMAGSHEILRRNDWQPVDLKDIITREARSFVGDVSRRIDISGFAVTLPARHVLTMSMAFHELFTNAAKYGALSTDTGKITMTTQIAESRASFLWTETQAAFDPAGSPDRKGFGSLLLTQVVPAELRAEVSYDITPHGAVFRMDFPIDQEVQQ